MEIAHIAPTSMIHDFCVNGLDIKPVQMCLAHQVLGDYSYAEFYRHSAANKSIVIMDNSLWELGNAMDIYDLIHACQLVQPSELIIPDVFRKGPETIESFHSFMDSIDGGSIDNDFDDYDAVPWDRNFVVVHGRNRKEWMETFDYFNEHSKSHTLGLPKVLDDMWTPGGRIGCVEFLEATDRINPDKAYHCLGIWSDPIEVLMLSRHKWIRSLDTALAIHAGMQNHKFEEKLGLIRSRPKRPHVYFGVEREDYNEQYETIQHNVNLLEKWGKSNGKAS